MNKNIMPSEINGVVRAPASKSIMQRCVVAGLLAEGETCIENPSFCDDALAALEISRQLGADVYTGTGVVRIVGGFNPRQEVLNCGESGLGIRMFSAIASLHDSNLFLTGIGSLETRPLSMIETSLRELGVQCETTNGLIPIRIKGPVKGGKAIVDGSVSSQFLTGLLMALPLAHRDSDLVVSDLKSKPYIDLTVQVLEDFGIEIENRNYERFSIRGNQSYRARNYLVEGDWSGAAFLLVAGALGGKVKVTGIQTGSIQGDRAILEVLELAGADVVIDEGWVEVSHRELNPFRFNTTECPDLVPPLVALAAHCNGVSLLTGARRLLTKESNRAVVLQKEFGKLGIQVQVDDDEMKIFGGKVGPGTVCSTNDHRIAMAAVVAGIRASGKIEIAGYECISKSYPGFFNDFINIGGIAYE